MNIQPYQKCYKLRRYFGKVPQEITVTKISGDNITFIWGHFDKEDLELRTGLMGGTCKKERIFIDISEEHKKILQKDKKKWNKILEKAYEIIDEYRAAEVKGD